MSPEMKSKMMMIERTASPEQLVQLHEEEHNLDFKMQDPNQQELSENNFGAQLCETEKVYQMEEEIVPKEEDNTNDMQLSNQIDLDDKKLCDNTEESEMVESVLRSEQKSLLDQEVDGNKELDQEIVCKEEQKIPSDDEKELDESDIEESNDNNEEFTLQNEPKMEEALVKEEIEPEEMKHSVIEAKDDA